MKKIYLLILGVLAAACGAKDQQSAPEATPSQPNIIIFYADDLGYGDLSCYGATAVQTPEVDHLAEHGVRFTDAHSSAATCTPSRYSLLTGNYAFRMQVGILPGDAPLLISPDTPTLPAKLKEVGYATAVVGKWHLGLGSGEVNWNEPINPGPAQIGFDYSFLLPSTGDRVPSVYVENQQVVGLQPGDSLRIAFTNNARDQNPFDTPTGISHPELLRWPADDQHSGVIVNGVSRIGFMAGAQQAWFKDEDMPATLSGKAIDFMDQHQDQPFFLYFPFHDIHVPRVPHPQFQGATAMGPRGDAIVQMDWTVGRVMKALDSLGLTENTLVIFSSDNGPILNDGYEDGAAELLGDHKPAGPFRGAKYSIYEAGNRMPTIAYWPGTIAPGVNDALWNQVDLLASLAGLAGYELAEGVGQDSEDVLPVILGQSEVGRTEMLEEAFTLGFRQGPWKYIKPKAGSDGWMSEIKKIESGFSPEPQLYHLEKDPSEQHNLAAEYPEKVQELDSLLQATMN